LSAGKLCDGRVRLEKLIYDRIKATKDFFQLKKSLESNRVSLAKDYFNVQKRLRRRFEVTSPAKSPAWQPEDRYKLLGTKKSGFFAKNGKRKNVST
jgi:hypothetical protein